MGWLLVGAVLLLVLAVASLLARDVADLFAHAREEEPMKTRWRLVAVPDLPQRLDVELQVDTTAPAVVEAIEQAARLNGVRLERMNVCGHEVWMKGCPNCEEQHRLATDLIEGAGR